ncbi:MAG TPA: hypothetical protein VKN63_00795, partial [Afifellaceae bacterium]|nr:hypothetical protein [Afifellaceae bacterium]
GETQVLKLDTRDFRITRPAQTGQGPGWISDHLAERLDASRILIIGGYVQTEEGLELNERIFELDIHTLHWQEREHGDLSLFPISKAEYERLRSPRAGTSNPEAVDNSFWREMARREWPPSRARLNFRNAFARPPIPTLKEFGPEYASDPPSPGTPEFETFMSKARAVEQAQRAEKRYKVLYPDHDIVWTAIREDTVDVALADGRMLRVGGTVRNTSDEDADAWIYNDIIVTDCDGGIQILAYPTDVFPKMIQLVGVLKDQYLFIFGLLYRIRPREEPRVPLVLRLDTSSFEMMLNRTAILPISGRTSLSTILGIRCLGRVRAAFRVSSAQQARSSISS